MGKGRTTKCLERVLYERAVDEGNPPKEDPGPCDWDDMTAEQVDAAPDKGRCPFHARKRTALLVKIIDDASGGRNTI